MSKLQSIISGFKYVPKKTFVLFGLLAAVLVPSVLLAWGPDRTTFTMDKPASYITFNSITDNPGVGDERNFTRIRETGSDTWSDSATIQEGKEYTIRMYVHNNAASNLNLVATNVRAALNLPLNSYTTNFTVNGFISADNAKPAKVWDQVTVKSDKEFRLQVVSAKYFNNVTGSTNGWNLSNDLFTNNNGGALLGYSSLNGKIPGCLQYAGYIIVKVKPEFKEVPKHPSYDVVKTVNKTAAKPGDTLEYTLTAKNTGDQDLTNVVLKDTLPSYIASTSVSVNAPSSYSGDLFGSGLKISKLPVGSTATVKITAVTKSSDKFVCGDTKLVNTVSSSTDQKKTEDNNNNNSATTIVSKECQVDKPNFDLVKTVDKTSAKPGESLKYTLTFKNTGNIALTNVVIKDTLPANVTYNNDLKAEPSAGVSGNLFGSNGLTIAKVDAGKNVVITFTVKVAATDKFVCGDTKLTNKSSSTTKEKTDESDKSNNNTDTVVKRDCQPNYDLVKTVDKKTAKAGDTLNYTLTFKNTGSQDLTNVVIKDTLPAGVQLTGETKADVTNGSGISDLDKLFSTGVKIAKVNVGGTVKITFSAKVLADKLVCGENKLVNKSSSTTSEKPTEPDTSNNNTTTTVNKECQVDKPNFDIVKTVNKKTVKPGETIEYTLTFKNTGNIALTNVVIKDTLPANLQIVGETKIDVTNGSGISDLDKLFSTGVKIAKVNVGGTAKITFTAKVAGEDKFVCGDTKLTNKSSSTTKEKTDEPDKSNNNVDTTVKRDCQANFDIVKTVNKATAKPGETIQYTLTFKNTGDTDLTNVVIKDQLPSGVTYNGDVKVEPATGVSGDLFGQGLVIAKVEAGKTVTITFGATVAKESDLVCGITKFTNVVSSTSKELVKEPNTNNNSATTSVNKDCKPTPKPCPTNPSIDKDDERCKPCEYDSSMNYDNPQCKPPTTPTTPTTPPTTYTPIEIVATGPVETLSALAGASALTFGATAYARSRKAARR
ncbi:MAG: hypothetical protein ACM3JF_01095 [Sphaerimonospora mesophila]